jgi:transcriptional regulator with GAF, ATPase, and Fis domain
MSREAFERQRFLMAGPETDPFPPGATPIVPARLRLLVAAGPDQGAALPLERGSYLLGRAPGCDLVLSDPAVSRQHLELQVTSQGVRVRDLETRNGSYHGGAAFREVEVGAGALFTIGATTLTLRDGSTPLAQGVPPSTAERFGGLAGRSLRMREVYGLLERVAPTEVPILIEGETGTGKELCAEAIHLASGRAAKPLIVCDLAGVSRALIESELFGHVRGAFTGADRDRDGAFALAHGGTIFIDEIGELELALQPRLLRALEQRKVKPVGATGYRDVDVRLLAATNRDLEEEVRAGRFRADLYHRLAVVRVNLPPLRDRPEDLPLLTQVFLADRPVRVPPETLALFAQHDWPGNVRELRNAIDRGLSLLGEGGVLAPELLGIRRRPELAAGSSSGGFRAAKERVVSAWEREYVSQLLERASGNVSMAAREGGLDRVYLHRLMKKHRIG